MDESMTTKPSLKPPKSSPKLPESSPQQPMSAPKLPVLRLRKTTESEKLKKKQLDVLRFPDGPWKRHPDEIDDSICTLSNADFPLDINIENYRIYHQEKMANLRSSTRQWPKSERMEHIEVMGVITIARLVDMEHILETNEGDIEDAIERSFVYCDTYDVDPN
jgi:hypothetical protein